MIYPPSGGVHPRRPETSRLDTTDGALVRRAVAGDRSAYGDLVRRWFRRVLALCQARLYSTADAEDAAQETFVRGYTELAHLSQVEQFGPWLRTIAARICVDHVRSRRRTESLNGFTDPPHSSALRPDLLVEKSEERTTILKQLHTLPEEYREVILLHYFDEMTYDDMACWLGLARATVNERLARGRDMLRRRLLPERRACHEL
jgi:RNA polymerase sigma-70 factor (ECF subfamily)